MKAKSFFTESPLILMQKKDLRYGEILAESYWQVKNDIYKASEPDTSEILANWWYNAEIRLNDNKIMILEWYTGFILDFYTQLDGVNVERIIFKPDAESSNYDKMLEAVNKMKNDYLSRFATKPFLIK